VYGVKYVAGELAQDPVAREEYVEARKEFAKYIMDSAVDMKRRCRF
jgi:hypothetical protein